MGEVQRPARGLTRQYQSTGVRYADFKAGKIGRVKMVEDQVGQNDLGVRKRTGVKKIALQPTGLG